MASLSCTGALAVSIDMFINIQQAQTYSRQAQETQNVAGGWQCTMSAVAQQSETYFNMAVKGQSNDLSTDAVGEAVLVDKDNLSSQELEEIDEEESVDGESEEDVVSEKIESCLQAFDLLDLHDANLELYKKCV